MNPIFTRSIRLTALCLLLAGGAFAATSAPLAADPVRVVEESGGLRMVLESDDLQWEPAEDGVRPLVEGAGTLGRPGGPLLPVYSRLVAVPEGMELVLEGLEVEWGPARAGQLGFDDGGEEEGIRRATTRDPAIYQQVQQMLAEGPVQVRPTRRWRDIRVAKVDLFPVRYDLAAGTVQSAVRLEPTFGFRPVAEADDGYDPPGISEAMLPLYQEFVVNTIPGIEDPGETTRGTYLMIVPDGYASFVEPLAQWRRRTGYRVDVALTSETGTSTASIKAFLDSYYTTADPPLDYVLLVGDADAGDNPRIETWFLGSTMGSIATDQKYTYDLSGDGSFENVLPRYLIGRLSVDAASELSNVVNKILQYEQTPLLGSSARWGRALLIADASFAISCKLTQMWVGDKLMDAGFGRVTTVVAEDYHPPAENISSAINMGVSWVAYRGFGGYEYWTGTIPDYHITHIDELTNTNNLPVITSMVCGGGAFDKRDENFAEAWIRAGSVSDPKGAVAFIGPSEIDTHTRWNNMVLAGWYSSLLDHELRTMGQCMVGSKILLYQNYPLLWNANGDNQNSVWFYFHTYNIIGDPALQLRAEAPVPLRVSHPDSLEANATRLAVTVTDTFDTPLEGARVTLTADLDTVLVSGLTGPGGVAELPVSALPSGSAFQLTVTRPDVIPYLADLPSGLPSGLTLTSSDPVEDPLDPANNGDGELNPGELILAEADFTVAQPGGLANAQAVLSLPEGGGEVVADTASLGTLAQGAAVHLQGLSLRLATDLEAGRQLPLHYTVTADGYGPQVHRALLPTAQAPRLAIAGLDFSQEWRPGRTASLAVTLRNVHETVPAGAVAGTLRVTDPTLTVLDSVLAWTDLGADSATAVSQDSLRLAVSYDAYPGRRIEARLDLTAAAGYRQHLPLALEVAGASEYSPTGPAGPGYYFYEDVDTGYEYYVDEEFSSIVDLPGTVNLGLYDFGNNQDVTDRVDLPFDFPYWDNVYDRISVCSNGWFSFGFSDLFFFRNRPLPGPLTPRGGVCVFWDDLRLNHTGSGIYTNYDEENGWFTIEWHDMVHFNAASMPMQFQARLLDPAVHGAPGGLGKILLLYDEISNNDANENYATVGITSPDGTEGLMYEFAAEPAPTAGGIIHGRSLLLAASEATGLGPPQMEIAEPSVLLTAPAGSGAATQLHIANTGDRSLRFFLRGEGIQEGEGGDELNEEGGPDDFGYRWYDGDEDYGPDYDWVDIEAPENTLTLNDGDASGAGSLSNPLPLPFTFSFYGADYNRVFVCESGYVTFVDAPNDYGNPVNGSLPADYAPGAAIFPFWDNIGTDEGGQVYYHANAQRVVVTWKNLRHLLWDDEEGPYTFQLVLTPDGAARMHYQQMHPRLNSATIGLQNLEGLVGLEISNNASTAELVHDQYAIQIAPDLPWLEISPTTAGVPSGGEQVVELLANAQNLQSGTYEGRILVHVPFTGEVQTLPVTFHVTNTDAGAVPRINPLPGQSVSGSDPSFRPLVLNPYVEDWDNGDDELSWDALDTEEIQVTIDPEANIASFSAGPDWDGDTRVTFRVLDPDGNISQGFVHLDNLDQNDPPFYDLAQPDALGNIYLDEQDTFSMRVVTSDPEGSEVGVQWYHRGELVSETSQATITFSALGPDTVRIVATDSEGAAATLTYTAHVYSTNPVADGEDLPTRFALESVYPNPFNARMAVRYALPRQADVTIAVYDLLGRQVARTVRRGRAAGVHTASFDAARWASGLYFVHWQAGEVSRTRKAVLIK